MLNNAERIKGIARDVYRSLGSGYSEEVYDRAMQVSGCVSRIDFLASRSREMQHYKRTMSKRSKS